MIGAIKQIRKICNDYLNNSITLSDFSLKLEHLSVKDFPSSVIEKLDNLIEFAAYTTVGSKQNKEDNECGFHKEPELKERIKEFLGLLI